MPSYICTTCGVQYKPSVVPPANCGLQTEDIIDVQETGALSGRDDAAGGSGDDMTTVSGNEPTDKF